MFDSLMGSKFSKKCKHCVKCINSRVVLIRRKKQATVKFLKKDVADLLANGHDSVAFGRIEALIVEINHTSCYDMIEKYCECILNQLPSLQKQRECPEEATEAIATLIFAAARFSDLPELFDLRRVFTERYGSHMESYVNAEFVEKIQKKSFSTERKIRLMEDIAEEFSVAWDSKAFRRRQTNPSVASFDQPKSSNKNNGQRSHPEMNQRDTAVSQRNEAAVNIAGQVNGCNIASLNTDNLARRTEAMFNADVANNGRYRAVHGGVGLSRKEVVLDPENAANGRAEAAIGSGAPVNSRDRSVPDAGSGSFNGRKESVLNPGGLFNGRKEAVLDADIMITGRKETVIDSAIEVNRRNEAVSSAGGGQELPFKERWETPRARFLQKQQVQPEPRDIHVVPSSSNGWSYDPAGRTRKVYLAEETENVEPYVNKRSQNSNHIMPNASENGIRKGSRSRSPIAQDGPGLIGLEKESAVPAISRDVKAVNMIPPSAKLKGDANGSNVADCRPVYDASEPEKVFEPHTVQERTSYPMNSRGGARPMNMIPPPYTKPGFRNHSVPSDETKFTDVPISSSTEGGYEMSNGGEKTRPVSVRRRLPKPSSAIEADNAIDDAKCMRECPTSRRKDERRVVDDNCAEVFIERYRREAPEEDTAGRRKHGVRRSSKNDSVRDEEEAAMDRLLAHYSNKGVSSDSSKRRPRTIATPEELVRTESERHHRPQRVASLPADPIVEDIGVRKGHARVMSMHPDLLSPNGGRTRAGLPDYDDLTARFIALKNS